MVYLVRVAFRVPRISRVFLGEATHPQELMRLFPRSQCTESNLMGWENATAYTYPVAATQMRLAGTAGDTATITISGLDANYLPISENLTLNGSTAVTTVNSYFRIRMGKSCENGRCM